jgi:hypothetical protein
LSVYQESRGQIAGQQYVKSIITFCFWEGYAGNSPS